jgi:(2R)-ethylmalonyl-CoA mutase
MPKDKPWIFRTYSGHSTPEASNALYRTNLAKGQTGLSVAFDLPTQTGFDSDAPEARGEVGKVGVPIGHLGDMRALFDQIPIEKMNTSMTINATAPWLLALYVALAEERGVSPRVLQGTTQNDVLKEFLARGTYVAPPAASVRLTVDVVTYTVEHVPDWNPMNVCSYHLQEAGATPVQELAYALANAIQILDATRERLGPKADLTNVFARLSFFVNAGIRFVDEICKMRAFGRLWERLGRERYGVTDEKALRFRYGVQVNSLGLTERQPENNIVRIVLEALGVTLSKDARCRALQLPAWNEALGLPRPWDQQWSLRIQQVLAYETDLLEHGDLFDGSHVIEKRTAQLCEEAWAEVEEVLRRGGALAAIESGYVKGKLVESNARRLAQIERGEQTVVGVNKFVETAESPLTKGADGGILVVDPKVAARQIERLEAHRKARSQAAVDEALANLRRALEKGENVMPASIAAAKAGVTTGEWGKALRDVVGDYRAPTGLSGASAASIANVRTKGAEPEKLEALRARVKGLAGKLGRPAKMLVGKPGLDGHSNGAEQIALKARDVGFEVVYDGIRSTPERIVASALEEGVHLIGLSILSGSHLELVPEILDRLKKAGLAEVPVVVGGIIPEVDEKSLLAAGVKRVYTPKDFELEAIMSDLVDLLGGQAA